MTKKKVPETPEEKVKRLETKQGQIAEKVGELKQSVDGFHSALSAMGNDLVGKMEGLFGQTQLRLDDVEKKQDRAAEADAARRKAEEQPVVEKETPILFASTEKAQTEATLAAANKIQEKAAVAPPPTPPAATAKTTAHPWLWTLGFVIVVGIFLAVAMNTALIYWPRLISAVAVDGATATPKVVVVTATPESGSVVAPSPSPDGEKATSVPAEKTATEIPATTPTAVPTQQAPIASTAVPQTQATGGVYPLAGEEYTSPQGDGYKAVWTKDGRLWQPNLPQGSERQAFTVAIQLAEGKYIFNSVEGELFLDLQHNGSGASNPQTVGFGNNLPFEVRDAKDSVAWALVEGKGNASTGFEIKLIGQ